jgi:tetratricopeptide (TPR) repeat protein
MQHSRKPLRPAQSRAVRMAALYDALAKAPNADAAKLIEARIDAARLQSGSPTADLLMARARLSVEAKNTRLALELLDAIVDLAPDYTEARAQRASIYYESKNIPQALADLRVIVAKDPKHYTALTGLGVIFDEIGQDKLALEAFRRALAVDPFLDGVPDYIKKLTLKVEGRDI